MADGNFYVLTVSASSREYKRIVAATDSEERDQNSLKELFQTPK